MRRGARDAVTAGRAAPSAMRWRVPMRRQALAIQCGGALAGDETEPAGLCAEAEAATVNATTHAAMPRMTRPSADSVFGRAERYEAG
jgi:hypothetical protein